MNYPSLILEVDEALIVKLLGDPKKYGPAFMMELASKYGQLIKKRDGIDLSDELKITQGN